MGARITEVTEVSQRFRRVGLHSHIKGLGVRDGKVLKIADGMVGQEEARYAAWIVVNLIREGRMGGKGVLIVGPPGTGKTALAVGIARELGEDTPFVAISGAEIYSTELKKTEFLMQAMRKAIGVRIREFRKVYEGVVKRIKIKYGRSPYNPYQQVPIRAEITLATKTEERTFRVDEYVTAQLIELGVSEGDVIWIDAETGRVVRVGRAEGAEEFLGIPEEERFEIGFGKRVPIPSGPIIKEKEFVYTVTLHELDVMQVRARSFLGLLFEVEAREIPSEVRAQVDEQVKKLVEEDRAELVPGVLFIDDAHMLDIEAFTFLSRAMESELSPIIILATNRGISKIRGTDIEAPHGMPLDLLDRLIIIKTRPYTRDEIKEILKIRAREEDIPLTPEALEKLADIGVQRSLRYAVQLMAPAYILATRVHKRRKVTAEDVEEAAKYFIDVKESTKYLREYEEMFLK